MKIGELNIKNPILLAPMAGVTDYPFRILCKEMGAGIVYSEFVSADGIIRENLKTLNLIRFEDEERPIGVQIFGSDANTMRDAARYVMDSFRPDIIDINYGCPVPKVTKKGAGSAALKDLCLMDEITDAVVEAVPDIPVTVKMRAGWDQNNLVSTEAGVRMEKIGVGAITLHPRTTKQQFSGMSNWSLIKELKEAVNIPVIGNGDVNSLEDYNKLLNETGCDGVMIGRAALGKPWIFNSLKTKTSADAVINPGLPQIINIAQRHFLMLTEYYNNSLSVNLSKKHFNYYFKGFNGASNWRKQFMKIKNTDEIFILMNQMTKELIN